MLTNSELTENIVINCGNHDRLMTDISGLSLFVGRQPFPRTPVIYHPSICVIAKGAKRIFVGEDTLSYDENHYLINALTLPIEAEVVTASRDEPCVGLVLDIDVKIVSELVLQMEQAGHEQSEFGSDALISASPLSANLQHALTRLVSLCQQPLDRSILADSIKREIFFEVLKGPQSQVLRNCLSQYRYVNRLVPVVQYISENFHRTLDIYTLADMASMSTSSLHQQFKAMTSLSPMQFVKNLRLHRARTLMLAGINASDACYQVGYSSPSQFSREYKRLFGSSPKDLMTEKSPLATLA